MKRWWFLLLLAANEAHAAPAVLTWQLPTKNCDGSAIAPITGFRVRWGTVGRVGAGLPATSSGACSDPSQVQPNDSRVPTAYPNKIDVSGTATTATVQLPDDGKKYFFSLTTLGGGGESPLTNEVSKAMGSNIIVLTVE